MKLLKFFLKYYLFRRIHSKKNIENVIRSQGIEAYRYDPEDPLSDVSRLMQSCNCWEHAQTRHSFLYITQKERYCFIKAGHTHDDQIILLFHEEAHIWHNHPFRSGLIDDSDIQKEDIANLFLFKLRLLKAATILLIIATLAAGAFFLSPKPSRTVAAPDLIVDAAVQADELPAQIAEEGEPADLVYITAAGDCYHRKSCGTITGSQYITPTTRSAAESLAYRPCSYCNP